MNYETVSRDLNFTSFECRFFKKDLKSTLSSSVASCFVTWLLARLRNHNATDDGNVDFRYFKKKIFYIQSLENKYKVVDLLVQKLSNDMSMD